MATTNQICHAGDGVSAVVDRYKGDDWPFYFDFGGVDVQLYTWTANLITEPGGVYTTTAISGFNGSVDSNSASAGYVYVTVSDQLTSTLTQDVESVNIPTSTQSIFLTRLALIGTKNLVTKTYAIVPIRVIKR